MLLNLNAVSLAAMIAIGRPRKNGTTTSSLLRLISHRDVLFTGLCTERLAEMKSAATGSLESAVMARVRADTNQERSLADLMALFPSPSSLTCVATIAIIGAKN